MSSQPGKPRGDVSLVEIEDEYDETEAFETTSCDTIISKLGDIVDTDSVRRILLRETICQYLHTLRQQNTSYTHPQRSNQPAPPRINLDIVVAGKAFDYGSSRMEKVMVLLSKISLSLIPCFY
jgi:3-isopropylmalate dehydratase small subunit